MCESIESGETNPRSRAPHRAARHPCPFVRRGAGVVLDADSHAGTPPPSPVAGTTVAGGTKPSQLRRSHAFLNLIPRSNAWSTPSFISPSSSKPSTSTTTSSEPEPDRKEPVRNQGASSSPTFSTSDATALGKPIPPETDSDPDDNPCLEPRVPRCPWTRRVTARKLMSLMSSIAIVVLHILWPIL